MSSSSFEKVTAAMPTSFQSIRNQIANVSFAGSYRNESLPEQWAILTLGSFMVMGAVGNVLVCIAIFTDRKLQNVTNYFLFSLAAVDLLVSLLVMPFSIATEIHHGRWPYGFTLCVSYTYIDVFLCSASIVHMSIISIDRYLGISRPLKARNKSKFVVMMKIITAWIITTAISCPIIVLAVISPRDIYQNDACSIDNPYFLIYGSTLAFLIPCLIMAAAYVRTTHLLRQQAITCGHTIGSGRSAGGSQRRKDGPSEGLRRTHVRHRSLRCAPERQRTLDNDDGASCGSRSRLNSPTTTTCNGGHVSAHYNHSTASLGPYSKSFETSVSNSPIFPTSTKTVDFTSSHSPIFTNPTKPADFSNAPSPIFPTKPADFTNAPSPAQFRRTPSAERNQEIISMASMQTEGLISPVVPATFRSKFKLRTINLWNRTTRRAASLSELASEQKATRVLGLVFVCFCVCWTPFFLHNFTMAFCRSQCQLPRWCTSVFLWLGYISSTINPIIYTAFNERFRRAFLRILLCKCYPISNRREQFSRLSGGGGGTTGDSFQTSSTGATYGGYSYFGMCNTYSM